MTTMKELTINDMASISGGNAPGDAVIGGLGGLASGLKFCKLPHPVLTGGCVVGFTVGGAYLG
ncbi:TPA: class IIb bacteriocin, lactobin A/cerein 7B family, partial [Streptococcus pyogenes]